MPVNEINSFKIQEWVEFSDSAQADVIVRSVEETLTIFNEIRGLLNQASQYQATWEGNAKSIHDDLYQFCQWYTNDIPPALEAYRDAAKILEEELNALATESTTLQKFKNVSEI